MFQCLVKQFDEAQKHIFKQVIFQPSLPWLSVWVTTYVSFGCYTLEIHFYQVNIVFVTNYSHIFLRSNILHRLQIASSVHKDYKNLSIT